MATATAQYGKLHLKTNFKVATTIESTYTGGKAVVTADERFLITPVGDDVNVMDLATGHQVFRLKGESDVISCLAVKPDGEHLVSASQSLLLKLWDLETGDEVRSWKAHEAPVIAMDFDATSTLVATGSADSTVKVWDVDGGFCTHNLKGHGGIISAVKFHSDKKRIRLVSGSDDCKIRVWDLHKRACVAVLDSHVSVIRGLDFSLDGSLLVSGARDKVLNVWNMGTYELEKTLPIYESVETLGVLPADSPFAEKGNLVVYTGGDKGIMRIWDVASGTCLATQAAEENNKHEISGSVYLNSTQTLVAITTDQNLLFYDVTDNLKRVRQIAGYNQEVLDLALVGKDDSHLAVVTNTEQLRVYNLSTMDCDILYGHTEIIMSVAASRDGTMLVSGSHDHTAVVWRFNADEEENADNRCVKVGTCVGHTEPVSAVAFPRKSNGFVITGSHDRTIKVWDIPITPSSSSEPVKLKTRYTFQAHDKDIQSIAVAPNDKVFASCALDKTAKLWSTDDGRLLGTFKGHRRGLWSVAFSPVDQILATSSTDKTIKLWNVTDFSCVKTFEGHTNSVLRCAFLSAGMQLVSCGSDGLLKLWTIRTNECVGTLDGHEDRIWALAVTKDETRVVSGSSDSTVVVWEDVTIQEQEEKQKVHEEQVLLEQDLSNYLHTRDYKRAILLALRLSKPHRLLALFTDLLHTRPDRDSTTGSLAVDALLPRLSPPNLLKLLTHLRAWNTNTRHARVAQTLLYVILHGVRPETLLGLRGGREVVEALVVYTERHERAAGEAVRGSFLVDWTVERMGGLDAVDDESTEEAMENGEGDEVRRWIEKAGVGNGHVHGAGAMLDGSSEGEEDDEDSEDQDEAEDEDAMQVDT
ncbi:WD40-repeat-containing domain protein [Fimicolochytrium jonesii]|uniref:WD40-repeat-containing domain protein n=1 Tax=Fimicolochytrium jonesii TaxID=1396493 RepID=UPI0022FECC75|nr:WD40-repeat-containing domain protein [Fimicolochytrium jonesii]KAI8816854.1 WD40-repeat-containing domain protein [Fimicolochytrium jonesii]